MKYIVKNPEPQEFINWKEQNSEEISHRLKDGIDTDAVWNLLPSKPPKPETEVESSADFTKEHLRQALLEEQGYLCCYCNRPLQGNYTTTLEHFLPKDRGKYPHLVFAYENLLACCDGGERDKSKPRETYYNAKKGNQDPTSPIQIVSPLEENCETFFEFDEMGNISAADGNEQSIATIGFLGLDARALNTLRKSYINEYIMGIWAEETDTASEIDSLRQKVNGKFFPFCTAIISVLRNYP
jgi:uncharacterized protein (TIGR02646 family)